MSVEVSSPSWAQLARQVRIDRICMSFEDAWRKGQRPHVQSYWRRGLAEDLSELLTALLEIDLVYRRRSGELPRPEDYTAQWPDYAESIMAAFEVADAVSCSAEKVQPGTRLGRYRIVRCLGQGAFGVVYLAEDEALGRWVALKMPGDGQCASEEQVARLVEEIRAAAQLRHPGIVAIYDVQRLAEGGLFAVLEYVDGCTLRQYAAQQRSVYDWARLFAEIAEAIAYAHQQGFVHRDLDPDNVLVDRAGHPRITDFGLALHEEVQRSRAGERAGSWAYMAPEQVRGEAHRLDGRADLWAIGVMLYECLTGRRPFGGDSIEQLVDEILHREPKPPRQIQPTIPRELEQICLRCLRKSIAERWTSGTELAEALRRFAQSSSRFSRRRSLLVLVPAAVGLGAVVAHFYSRVTPRPALDVLQCDVQVWRMGSWSSVRLPWALPLRDQESVRLYVHCAPPQYIYVFWLDSRGTIAPVYPWHNGQWEQRRPERRLSELVLPQETADQGYPTRVTDPGYECILAGVRDELLSKRVPLETLVSHLAEMPRESLEAAALITYTNVERFTLSRSINPQDRLRIDTPLVQFQQQLRMHLLPYFHAVQCVIIPSTP